jgi:hypothetical protein
MGEYMRNVTVLKVHYHLCDENGKQLTGRRERRVTVRGNGSETAAAIEVKKYYMNDKPNAEVIVEAIEVVG